MSLSPKHLFAAGLRAALLLWLVTFALAAPAAAAEKRVALVIGNAAYQRAPSLANPVDDAKAVSAALRGLGLEVTEGYDLTGRDMRALLIRFANSMAGAKGALVFYAGHGVALDGVNYMLPVDIDPKSAADLDLNGFSVDIVMRQMRRDERVNIIILDACRDNPFAVALTQVSTRAVVATRGLEKIDGDIARGALIAFSTEPGRTAFDGAAGQHSPFTAALLRHIADPAAPIETVMRKVREEVYEATASRQLPWVNTSIVGEFQLNPAVAPPPVKVASAEAGSIPSTENLLWQSAERSGAAEDYQTYLDAYPQGVFAPLARRRVAAAHELSPEAAEVALNLGAADRIAAQTALKALKFDTGAADGVFGPTARAAISAWQSRSGYPATGFFAGDQMARLIAEAPKSAPRATAAVAPAPKPVPARASRRERSISAVAVERRAAPEKERTLRHVRRRATAPNDPAEAMAEPAPAQQAVEYGGPAPAAAFGGPAIYLPHFGFGFGGHRHAWSDRRLKRDIRRVGASPSGLPVYTFRYLWSSAIYRGVMAQDLLKLRPGAVHRQGAYYWVDYSALDVKFERVDVGGASPRVRRAALP
jgi:uncharacterized caspase-like protein